MKQKMSLEKMRTVLSNVLSREEMKQIQAGSGPGSHCGSCSNFPGELADCFLQNGTCFGCGHQCANG